jgi:hypothetical protein
MIGASETKPIPKMTMIQCRHFTGRPKLDTNYALQDCLVNMQQFARLCEPMSSGIENILCKEVRLRREVN